MPSVASCWLSGLACLDDPRRRQRFSPAVPAVRVAAGDPHGHTVSRSPRPRSLGCRASRSGGFGWGSPPCSSPRPRPIRTARTSVCIERSKPKRRGPPRATWRASSDGFTRFAIGTTTSGPTKRSGSSRPCLDAASPRPWPRVLPPLEYPRHYERRRVSAPGVMSWHTRNITVIRSRLAKTSGSN